MGTTLSLNDLMDYTDWERQKWQDWIERHGRQVLKTSAGPNGDGRFATVGDLMRHMFSAERLRPSERLFRLGTVSNLITFAAVVPLASSGSLRRARAHQQEPGVTCSVLAAGRMLHFCAHQLE
jgi:hypothetical protein